MAADLTRRLFLRGAALVAPALAVPASAALASSYVEESAKLLALEPALDAAITERTTAAAAYAEAFHAGMKLWPRAPEAIQGRSWMGDNLERDIRGAGYQPSMHIHSASALQISLQSLMRKRKVTLDIEEARHHTRERLEIAKAYEAQCAAAKEAVGYEAAYERDKSAAAALHTAIDRIQAAPCKTMAGIRLKAKALEAWDQHGGVMRLLNLEGREKWMPDFCRALIEVLEGA